MNLTERINLDKSCGEGQLTLSQFLDEYDLIIKIVQASRTKFVAMIACGVLKLPNGRRSTGFGLGKSPVHAVLELMHMLVNKVITIEKPMQEPYRILVPLVWLTDEEERYLDSLA